MSTIKGASSELLFRYECIKRNIIPSVPDMDDGAGFDVISSYENKLYKIQIKSTDTKKGNGYRVACSKGNKTKTRYTKEHCDFIAIFILGLESWYIIPTEDIKSISITLFPNKLNHKFSKYFSAWHLLAS